MTPLPEGAAVLDSFTLNLSAGRRLVAEVIRTAEGQVRTRLGRGEGVGTVLDGPQLLSLRRLTEDCLSSMFRAELAARGKAA